jgi:ElaB/YqjD/DUF883 family membrane-anchored ribosome-binding protein
MQEDNKQIENELTSAYAESEKLSENLNKIIRGKQISDTEYQELNLKYNTVLRKLQKCDTRNTQLGFLHASLTLSRSPFLNVG